MNVTQLNKEEYIRYSRQLSLPGFGLPAQQRIKASRVLVVGAGGLGIPVLQYLVAAGVGTIGVIDPDIVDLSNLHRQVIYHSSDVGSFKVLVAKQRMNLINPNVTIHAYPDKLDESNVDGFFMKYDLVVDGTDNLPTRYLINDHGVACGIPIVYGAIFRYEGQVSVFNYELSPGHRGPNYRDLFPEQATDRSIPNCAETGVIGVLPAIIGSFQAMEAIKLITGIGDVLSGKLLVVDILTGVSRIIKYHSRNYDRTYDDPAYSPDIPFLEKIPCTQKSIQPIEKSQIKELAFGEYLERSNKGEEFQVIDVRELHEPEHDHLHGTRIPLADLLTDPSEISGETSVLVFCQVGQRSAAAARHLKEHYQLNNIYNLKGGLDSIDN